jgi:hypothetical protein
MGSIPVWITPNKRVHGLFSSENGHVPFLCFGFSLMIQKYEPGILYSPIKSYCFDIHIESPTQYLNNPCNGFNGKVMAAFLNLRYLGFINAYHFGQQLLGNILLLSHFFKLVSNCSSLHSCIKLVSFRCSWLA